MKKNILTLSTITLLSASVVFTSCKKDDVTAPVVTLTGSDMTISLQGSFSDPGATANDAKDGAITPVVSGNVDVNHTGVYEITYTATDAAGNSAAVCCRRLRDLEPGLCGWHCFAKGVVHRSRPPLLR